ncbi:MAG TPA: hypothetical protein VE287_13260 [Actinopolymorphaceae bacterium]|nr:hypothetical protein [Actinopolymorphaceae bacterium]
MTDPERRAAGEGASSGPPDPSESRVSIPAWQRQTPGEHRLPAALAVLAVVALQLAIPPGLAIHPRWLLPAVELAIVVVLSIADPGRMGRESTVLRTLGLSLVAAASLATAWSAVLLIVGIVANHGPRNPTALFVNGGAILLTNIIVFGLWYWELDRGGPAARANARMTHPDFLFPQMSSPELHVDWEPTFADYLYVAFTNSVAFSPTDAMPLSRWAKFAMMFQASVSIVVVILVIARGVNVLR